MMTWIQSFEKTESALAYYDLDKKEARSVDLPSKIKEISGLAITKNDRLFCHDDERGIVYQIDFVNGNIIKKFMIGKFMKKADFEGIAIAKNLFYLVTSDGKIIEFKEGENKGSSSYKLFKTGLNKKHDVEGLCYDPETDCLLLACKGEAGEQYKKYKAVYAFSLKSKKLLTEPRFLIKENKIAKESKEDEFKPSGIARHPLSGTFFIIASEGNIIIEMSTRGKIIAEKKLSKDVHSQPEGISFTSDYTLLISDEGNKKGKLTRYKMKK